MTPITINDLRVTLIWSEISMDLLESASPEQYPLAALGHGFAYKARVKQIQAGQPDPAGLQLPWRAPAGNRFWSYYLGRVPGSVKPRQAWEYLLPLRGRLALKVNPTWADAKLRLALEPYYYSFGFGLAVTLYFKGEPALDDAVKQALKAVRSGMFTLQSATEPEVTGRLSTIALACLQQMRLTAFGQDNSGGTVSVQPYSIATIVRGSGVDPQVPLDSHPEVESIQRALEALSNWQPNWQTVALPAIHSKEISLDKAERRSSPGDILYAGKNGRAVWYPGRFTLVSPTKALSCYHRNLVLGSLHTAMLARFLAHVHQVYPNQAYRNRFNLRGCTKAAAEILGKLHNGSPNTYRSGSVQAQISKSDTLPAVNEIRGEFQMPPIPAND